MTVVRVSLLALVTLAAACEVGVTPGGGGGGDDIEDPQVDAGPPPIDAPIARYTVAVSPPAAATILGTETTFTVTLGSDHYDGPVALAVTGAPTSWTVTVTPASVTLTDGGTATAQVKVAIPPNGDAAPAGQTLTIGATAAPGPQSTTAALTVAKEYAVTIGAGTGTGTHFGALNGGLVRVKTGTVLHIRNADTTAHRIHSGGGIGGFPHQPNNMGNGEEYRVTVQDGSDVFYCHVHERGAGDVNLVVE